MFCKVNIDSTKQYMCWQEEYERIKMITAPKWQYNEIKFSGVDYSGIDEVAAYDSMHKKFWNYTKSSEDIIRRLSLDSDSTVIDLGSGTGAFTLHAAKKCRTVIAVDISAAMLEYCRQQAERGIDQHCVLPGRSPHL